MLAFKVVATKLMEFGGIKMLSGLFRVVCAVAALFAGTAAQAEWLEATSPHFVIYANASEKDVREQAVDLERLDMVMRRYHGVPDTPEARGNKVTIYVGRSVDFIQELCRCKNTAGMYMPKISGPVVFTPRRADQGPNALNARTVLFHEYGHHFLLGTYSLIFPAWFTEGFAEFISTVTFKDGTAMLGGAAQHRAYSLLGPGAVQIKATRMFDEAGRRGMKPEEVSSLYARAWALTHYVSTNADRYKQLQKYLEAINGGTPGLTAAQSAFGDLRALDKALDSYIRKPLYGMNLKDIVVPDSAVTIRPLSAGAAAMMDVRARSTFGVNRTTALPLFNQAQPIAARFPDDAVAQGWFAEIAYDARRFAEANAAADRALAIDPKSVQALLYKARLLTVGNAVTPDARSQARKLIVRANRVDQDDAEPLWMYYRSFGQARETPTKAAITGLYRAVELVPQDNGLRMAAAQQLVRDGEIKAARGLLARVAFDPHAPPDSFASRVVAAIDAGKTKDEILALRSGPRPPETPGGKEPGTEDAEE